MVEVLDAGSAGAIERAAHRLAKGRLVAFPTETVYGLGARADDAAAVRGVFAAKGRPSAHPLIVHVTDEAAAQAFAARWPDLAARVADAFWPGPVTVIVPRRQGCAEVAAGCHGSIGLRCPSHPVSRQLLAAAAALGVPGVAAPSANRFGKVSPTLAAHVAAEFGDPADLLILDGGACEAGIESAIVDCTRERPVLLRPGTVARDRLERVTGPLQLPGDDASPAPGTLRSHYAPRARVRLMTTAALRAAVDVLALAGAGAGEGRAGLAAVAVYSRAVPAPAGMHRRVMPDDPAAAAHELFAVLRELDSLGVQLVWVEQPPDTPGWDGVRDRLERAAAT